MGGGRDAWEEAGMCGRRPGCVGGGQDAWEEAETRGRRPGGVGGMRGGTAGLGTHE